MAYKKVVKIEFILEMIGYIGVIIISLLSFFEISKQFYMFIFVSILFVFASIWIELSQRKRILSMIKRRALSNIHILVITWIYFFTSKNEPTSFELISILISYPLYIALFIFYYSDGVFDKDFEIHKNKLIPPSWKKN